MRSVGERLNSSCGVGIVISALWLCDLPCMAGGLLEIKRVLFGLSLSGLVAYTRVLVHVGELYVLGENFYTF